MHTALMPVDQEMAARLRKARLFAGFGKATHAVEHFRLKYSTYAGHENGSKGFYDDAARYAKMYKVRLDWLLENEGPMELEKTAKKSSDEETFREFLAFQRWRESQPD